MKKSPADLARMLVYSKGARSVPVIVEGEQGDDWIRGNLRRVKPRVRGSVIILFGHLDLAALYNPAVPEEFTDAERARLAPYFTNLDGHVFALTNLPETVKGALFARYSRSAKSLRRLFLDEFADKVPGADDGPAPRAGPPSAVERAEKLYARVFNEYGDDSVAQLGGAHIACEYVSNILTKVLEWGRLMAYLEQSTRYVPYTDKLHGRWRYHVPAELGPARCGSGTCGRWTRRSRRTRSGFRRCSSTSSGATRGARRIPKPCTAPRSAPRRSTRCAGCCPAATQSNVGIYGTGQAFESLLLRMRAHPLEEVRACADAMLVELRKLIPAFLTRVDQPDRGGRWSEYLSAARDGDGARSPVTLLAGGAAEPRDEVTLTDFDPDGEIKIVAAALYAVCELPDDQLLAIARRMTADERASPCFAPTSASARNRRHRPGRAFERTMYRFDVLTDYGAFRDLQRHRLLTLEWQRAHAAARLHRAGGDRGSRRARRLGRA